MLLGWLINSKTRYKSRCQAIAISFLLCLLAIACEDRKIAQCEQIFQIAQSVPQSSESIDYANNQNKEQSWSKTANKLALAADSIDSLKIDHRQLVQYQSQLAAVYRIYSQATYDAIEARENKNLSELEVARKNAMKAGKIQQNLVGQINTYCLF